MNFSCAFSINSHGKFRKHSASFINFNSHSIIFIFIQIDFNQHCHIVPRDVSFSVNFMAISKKCFKGLQNENVGLVHDDVSYISYALGPLGGHDLICITSEESKNLGSEMKLCEIKIEIYFFKPYLEFALGAGFYGYPG